MLELLIAAGVVALLGAGFYLRKNLPWPFRFEGKKYRRMPDGTFQDAAKNPVTDGAFILKLAAAYEAAKYGTGELKGWDADNS